MNVDFGKYLMTGVLTALVLAGCSKPSERVPDYHALIPTADSGPQQAALENAKMKCAEASSAAAEVASPWCGVVQKVKVCVFSLKGNQGPMYKTGHIYAPAAEVAAVTARPTVSCPPK